MKLIITDYEGLANCQDSECKSEPIYQLENPYHGLVIYSCVDCIGEAIDFEYQHNFEDGKDECENCGETDCEWLEYNDGVCCRDNGDLEYPKYCSPCVEDKTADMIDTARDIEKEKMFD